MIKSKKKLVLIAIFITIVIFISCKVISNKEKDTCAYLYRVANELILIIDDIDKRTLQTGNFEQAYKNEMSIEINFECITFKCYDDIDKTIKKYRTDLKYLKGYAEEYMENAEKYIETGEGQYKEGMKRAKQDILDVRTHYDGCHIQMGIFTENKKVEPMHTTY